jgi:D-xylose transport system ATP-binding protein
VQALTDVDFEVHAGEVVALVGDNGAGKSTLIKCVSGAHLPDTGTILVEGEEVKIHAPSDATRLGIETVYQDLALCDNLDVVANMFLGREDVPFPLLGPIEELAMEKRSLEVLDSLHVTTIPSVRQRVASLSGGQRQSVAISRAVMWRAKIVILDEPTAALGVAQTEQVLALIRRLREQRLGVVVITHNLHEVFEVADRIVVLRLGRRVATFTHEGTTPEDVVAAITGARVQVAP